VSNSGCAMTNLTAQNGFECEMNDTAVYNPASSQTSALDRVEEASEESFPASDPPSWIGGAGPLGEHSNAGALQLTLDAKTAADLMSNNVISIRSTATVDAATVLLTDKCFSAVPVIDEAGRPIGVISQSDLVVHARESALSAKGEGSFLEALTARDLMTPGIIAVALDTPARKVIEELTTGTVHQLYVADARGILVGSVSAGDVLKHVHF
jgi:CBS-domain-containing membrane protein